MSDVRSFLTLRIFSAFSSHFAFPSFSVIELRSSSICVVVILDTDDWLELAEEGLDVVRATRSKVLLVGEVSGGEKVKLRGATPPPLPPPPPTCDVAAEFAVSDAGCEAPEGVLARDRGDESTWEGPDVEPDCRGGKDDRDEREI